MKASAGSVYTVYNQYLKRYHPHKGLNRAIAQHLMQGNLQDNLDRL